ncbi:cytochrome P450, partial [Mycobacterium kansasii]
LAHAPKALEQLKEEHQALRTRKKDGEPLTWDDIQQLEFNSHVIYEALRCGNLVKFVHRKAIQDVNFKGYHIPAGCQVLPVFTA